MCSRMYRRQSQIIHRGSDQTVSSRITLRLPPCPSASRRMLAAEHHVGSFFVRIAHHSGCDVARWKSRPMKTSRRPDGRRRAILPALQRRLATPLCSALISCSGGACIGKEYSPGDSPPLPSDIPTTTIRGE